MAVPYSEDALELARETAAAAAGQHGPLRMLAAWLLIIGAVIVTTTVGTIATVVLVALMIPILALGVVWVVSRNLGDQAVAGVTVREVVLVAGPLVAVAFLLVGSWPFALLALVATVIVGAS